LISVKNLEHRYGAAAALRLPDWQVLPGEHWAVLGPSGSGKSTLLHILAGLQRPSAGEIRIDEVDISSLRRSEVDRWRGTHVGIVLQALHLVAHLTVRGNLRLAQYLAHLPQDDAKVDAALEALGVADKAERRPGELSQGEQQRVAIARAVVNGPKLLLADEPTASLDDASAERAVALLGGEATRRGATLIVATHDRRVKSHFQKELVL